tara:strand:+ start:689 stop:1678 length:990 start_codon:yes stop_codon:yes gene_type:complete
MAKRKRRYLKKYSDGGKPEVKIPFKGDGGGPKVSGPQLPKVKTDSKPKVNLPSGGGGDKGDKTVQFLQKRGEKQQSKVFKGYDPNKDAKQNVVDMSGKQVKGRTKKAVIKKGIDTAQKSRYISPQTARNLRTVSRFGRMGPMGAMAGISYGMLDNYDEAHEQAFGPGLRDVEKTHGKKTRDRVENTTHLFGGVGGQKEGHLGGAGMGYKSKMEKGGLARFTQKKKKKKRARKYFIGGLIKKAGGGVKGAAKIGLFGPIGLAAGHLLGKKKKGEAESAEAAAIEKENAGEGSAEMNPGEVKGGFGGLFGAVYGKMPKDKQERINKILAEK